GVDDAPIVRVLDRDRLRLGHPFPGHVHTHLDVLLESIMAPGRRGLKVPSDRSAGVRVNGPPDGPRAARGSTPRASRGWAAAPEPRRATTASPRGVAPRR